MPSLQNIQYSHSHTEPSNSFKAKVGASKLVSYEDLLIAQYIDDVKKPPDVGTKNSPSPYLGKYHSLEEGLYKQGMVVIRPTSGRKDRPVSAQLDRKQMSYHGDFKPRPYSAVTGQKPKIDAKFIADPNLWDPATPRDDDHRPVRRTQSLRWRPDSAQSRSSSAKYSYSGLINSEVQRSKRPRKKKPLYKRQPYVIRCIAYKNGDRDIFAQITAPNVKQLLEACTTKLQLNGAARRIFLDDGSEIFETKEIPKDGEIYVSNGEAFKNPFKTLIERHEQREQLQWTLSGITLPQQQQPKKSKFLLSKRFKKIIAQKNRRVMCYQNGQHTNCHEVITDMISMKDLLADITTKFSLTSHARILYDWNGEEIEAIQDIPVLDDCLQETGTPVLGPVWVSTGGGFSPTGARNFVQDILSHLKQRRKTVVHHKKQHEYMQAGQQDNIQIKSILSLSEEEVEENLKQLNNEDKELKRTIDKMKAIHEGLSSKAQDEVNAGYSYTLQHIKEVDASDPVAGGQSLKLKIHPNGQYLTNPPVVYFNQRLASRGLSKLPKEPDSKDKNEKRPNPLLERLLDLCASKFSSAACAGTKFAKRLFDGNGDEITEVNQLKNDDELFLSAGENFIAPYVLCLQVQLDQVRGIELNKVTPPLEQNQSDEANQRNKTFNMTDDGDITPEKEEEKKKIRPHAFKPGEIPQLNVNFFTEKKAFYYQNLDISTTNKQDYEGSIGLPADYHWIEYNELNEYHAPLREEMAASQELDINSHFLVHKEQRDLILYPTVVVSEKKKKGSNDIWPTDAQQWVLTQDGFISLRSMPYMVLAALDLNVECSVISRQASKISGFAVGLQKKQEENPAQQWKFTKEGQIYCQKHPKQFLTFLGAKYGVGTENNTVKNEVEGTPSGFTPYLAVCEELTGKDASLQRFAMKQERFENLGQWKHNDHSLITNQAFNKCAYSWPVDAEGEWIKKFDWPMEFFLICKAPPLQKSKKDVAGHIPLRLNTMKNGETDIRHSSPVVGPDLTNMMKDLGKDENTKKSHHGHRNKSKKDKKPKNAEKDDSVSDVPLHCDDLTFRELEFRLFLERCTGALNLPFAARRLFDDEGREHFTLKDLSRDQLVYVSCGEAWIDPHISKAEAQRRFILTNLASDLVQIRQFCALRDTEGYVMEVEGAAVPNAKIIINHTPDMREQLEKEAEEQEQREKDELAAQIETDLMIANMSAHERAHQRLDDKPGDKLKWNWEKLANEEFEGLQESPRRSPSPQRSKMGNGQKCAKNIQKFVYDDGYIACHADLNLVIGIISDSEGQKMDVSLVKRKRDELTQMWLIKPNGYIQSKQYKDMVLSVSMPTNQRRDEDGLALNYAGCQVTLQKRKISQFGSANQKWCLDTNTCFINAFHTNHTDVEITAANKSNVCTYAVIKEEIDQPGYTVSLPSKNGKSREVVVCVSCARAMRGRYKLTRLPENFDFSCAMGTTKHKELRNIGSFRCLNGKVDLSTFEAINTLDEWETKYNKLFEETSVRSIAREISAAEQPRTVKVYAYKNGEGRTKAGQLVVGTSIIGLLDQCTFRLAMTNAGRRLYARDGTPMLDVEDIISWGTDHYKAHKKQKRKEEKGLELGSNAADHLTDADSQFSEDTVQYSSAIEVTTDGNAETYEPISEALLTCDHLLFEVTTNSNPKMALLNENPSEKNLLYEIILGRTTDSAIVSYMTANQSSSSANALEDDPQVKRYASLSATTELVEMYWLSWEGNIIRIGTGKQIGENELMSTNEPCPLRVNSVLIASQGARTTWKFQLPVVSSIVSEPSDKKLMNKVQLDDSDEENDTGSKKDDSDTPETVSKAGASLRPKTPLVGKIEEVPVEEILKYPIEVWVSSGESFIKPEKVSADQKEMKHYRNMVAEISFELAKEKHKLRQLQGRRYKELNPGMYESTGSAVVPVIKKNHWQEPSYNETLTHEEINQLQNQQTVLRAKEKAQGFKIRTGSRLYKQPMMKRVLAFVNGEPISRAQYVWGDNMEELLQNATSRLNMRRPAKTAFNLNGEPIGFEDLGKDQIVCVSTGGGYQRPKEAQQDVEIRANWTRARKLYGPEATEVTVTAQLNPDIDVDPFGPPSLASRSGRNKQKNTDNLGSRSKTNKQTINSPLENQ